jgi:methylenetetrahydrofolate reductase (NADPH)
MSSIEPSLPSSWPTDPVARIVAFARSASFETTHLSAAQLSEVKAAAPQGAAIFVSAIPSRPLDEQIETAKALRDAGFDPVPHFAARNFPSIDAMSAFAGRMVEASRVTRALVIAGDRPNAAGDLHDALAAIKSGVLQRHGITDIGISGYPEGHPRIAQDALDRALTDKLAAAQASGLRVRIVTQFTMSTEPVVAFVSGLRARGINNPIGVGLAGPASMTTLLRFARICGVKASAQGLVRNAGLLKNLIGASTADPIVRALADAKEQLGDIYPHFFSFGGLPATVRWAAAAAEGRFKLSADGFDIAAK